MALTDVEKVRILIGDVPGSVFYQLFSDEEIQMFLDLANGDVFEAAKRAAIAASMQLAGYNTRERTGDIEVWNSLATQYLKALDNLINTPTSLLPQRLTPYAGGISKQDMFNNDSNQDNVRPKIYEGFDSGERPYNHLNSTEDESKYIDTLARENIDIGFNLND